VVLHHTRGGRPPAGLRAALENSEKLITAIQRELPAAAR
jgi:D-alanyl-D-alanine carboxypeptidase (penicillin-binding protein 5/6)